MPDEKKQPDDVAALASGLLGALKLPGEAALVALLGFLTEWVAYERAVLAIDPDTALAGRRRLEENMKLLDALRDKVLESLNT